MDEIEIDFEMIRIIGGIGFLIAIVFLILGEVL